ncbi:hypothetical protein O3M35_001098 [Rhynocoris fuscipes]|uniref:CHK kinase-like domain-containing protein n=1 Tax=Rhynocoris fuscipes TaxID=488301 RepID=A0AAW1DQ18_9HEMI
MEPEFLEALFRKKQEDSGISRVLSIKSEPAVPGGENFLSAVQRVTAEVMLGSGVKRTISVIVKGTVEAGPTSDLTSGMGFFDSESKVYSHILKGMEDLMEEFGDKRGLLWCDIYGYSPTMIVFEDLKRSDFKVTDRTECLDLAHSKLAIRSLARLHAMSKILLKRKYFTADDLKPYPIVANIKFAEKLYGNGLRVLAREVKTWGSEWQDIATRLEKYANVLASKMSALSVVDETKFNVMNHGDPWICNFMFMYDPYENRPIAMRMLDFQFCHYQTYAWDLNYFIHICLLGDLRREYFNELLGDYAKELERTLLFYNYLDNDIPTHDDVKAEMERTKDLRMSFCLLTHPLLTAPVKKQFSLDECLSAGELLENNCGYNLDMFRIRYKDEIGPDIKRLADEGVF